ncbi:hypothetical protein VTK73DRAFT_5763 [Phialemonium thermophilum]|uniref:Uncharacterized protein n=1 Tax=Phialemonium thermophilum TaxID=223376 RepID=A0ABR3WM25_9PEZI
MVRERDGVEGLGKSQGGIDQVPLWRHGLAEVEAEGLDEKDVVHNGLKRIDCADGGLTRCRLAATGEGRAACGPGCKLDDHAQLQAQLDGESFDVLDHPCSPCGSEGSAESMICVSLLDPLGHPSFRASPTKHVPSWMRGPRKRRAVEDDRQPLLHSPREENFISHSTHYFASAADGRSVASDKSTVFLTGSRTPPTGKSSTFELLGEVPEIRRKARVRFALPPLEATPAHGSERLWRAFSPAQMIVRKTTQNPAQRNRNSFHLPNQRQGINASTPERKVALQDS